MTRNEREIPPGHTRPPIPQPSPLIPGEREPFTWPNPMALPRVAQRVLLIAMVASVVFVFVDPEPLSGVVMVAIVSIAAFAEARRDASVDTPITLGHVYDRAIAHAVWVAAAVWPVTMLAIWVRNLLGLFSEVAQ